MTSLSASPAESYYVLIGCWGRENVVGSEKEMWTELMLKFDKKKKKKITLATAGPYWANLNRQIREAAQQSGKVQTNTPCYSQPTNAIAL